MSDAVLVGLAAALGLAAGYATRPLLATHGAPQAAVPVPELLTALLFALSAGQYDDWRLVPLLILSLAAVALSLVDLVQYRLPNAILFPALTASAAVIVIGELADGDASVLSRAAVGAVVYSGLLFVLHVVNPAGMGFGDVKLGIMLGMFIGWVADSRLDALRAVMLALIIGSLLGLVLGVGRMLLTRLGATFLPDPEEGSAGSGLRHTTFPFGPPLMIGALAVTLYPATFLG